LFGLLTGCPLYFPLATALRLFHTTEMKILFFFFLTWLVKAAESANTDSAQMVEEFEQVDTAENENMESDAVMTESEESEEMKSRESANETWHIENKKLKGPAGFVLKYLPEQKKGLAVWHTNRGGRRRHNMLKPEWLKSWKKNKAADIVLQDFERDNKGRLYNRAKNKCLDAQRSHEDDLCFWNCHNGGNQQFWFEQWGDDGKKGAVHIHIGGNARNRRRHACVDMGGGRLYIHGCHNGDNQRWVKLVASTTTSTTTTTTVLETVSMMTASFPEKIEWIIHDVVKKRPVPGCSGKSYSTWYSEHKTGCKLTKGRRYKITCFDKLYNEGWAEGYLKIGKKKICDDFTWDQNKASKEITYP